MLTDYVIFNKIKEGDIRTFEQIFRLYYTSLCMYAFSITNRKDVSEEVVQDVFYNIWKERERLPIVYSVKNYLYGAVRNHALRYQERLKVQERHQAHVLHTETTETDFSPQELLEYKELESIIINILTKLPERRMQIFRMHRVEGKKYREIADFYSISVKTVEAEMTKAYRALRQGIEKYRLHHGA